MFNLITGALIRHASTGLGGALISAGVMQSNDSDKLLGSLFFLGGLAWSAFNKYALKGRGPSL